MKLGNPTNTAEAAARGRKISIREVDSFAQTVLPIIASIQQSGMPVVLREARAALVRSEINRRSFSANAAQHERIGIGAKFGDDKRHPLDHQAGNEGDIDLPLNFHPVAIRASAVSVTPYGAV
ncbi:hypothetical protein L2331_26595 [Mesorhizobium muleiense]|nr:hypothetical protein [Mesorhizobium muleiense]